MFKTITNPLTNQKYSIFSEHGKNLLKKYIQQFNKGILFGGTYHRHEFYDINGNGDPHFAGNPIHFHFYNKTLHLTLQGRAMNIFHSSLGLTDRPRPIHLKYNDEKKIWKYKYRKGSLTWTDLTPNATNAFNIHFQRDTGIDVVDKYNEIFLKIIESLEEERKKAIEQSQKERKIKEAKKNKRKKNIERIKQMFEEYKYLSISDDYDDHVKAVLEKIDVIPHHINLILNNLKKNDVEGALRVFSSN